MCVAGVHANACVCASVHLRGMGASVYAGAHACTDADAQTNMQVSYLFDMNMGKLKTSIMSFYLSIKIGGSLMRISCMCI